MKRVLALALSLLFVLTLLPASARAETYSHISVTPNVRYFLENATFAAGDITVKTHTSDSDAGTVVSSGYTTKLYVDGSERAGMFTAAEVGKTVTIAVQYAYLDGSVTKTLNATASLKVVNAYPTAITLTPDPTPPMEFHKGDTLGGPGGYVTGATVTMTDSTGPLAPVSVPLTDLTFSPALDYQFTDADLAAGTKTFTVSYTKDAGTAIETTHTQPVVVTLVRKQVTAVAYAPVSPITLMVGSSIGLAPSFTPDDAIDGITWTVTDGDAFINKTVFENSGVLVGVSAGTAHVNAKLNTDTGATGADTDFTVTVVDPPSSTVDVASLSVSLPDTKVFIKGENFDPTGMVVKALLANEDPSGGTVIDPANYAYKVTLTSSATTWYAGNALVGPLFNATGTATVTVRYRYLNSGGTQVEKTKTFTVAVVDSTPLFVEIVSQPKITTYYLDEKLDTTGLAVRIAYTKDRTTVSGYGTQTLADCYIPGLTDKMDAVGPRSYEIQYTDKYGESATAATLTVSVANSIASVAVNPVTLNFEYSAIASATTQPFTLTLPAGAPASAVAWENSNPKVASYVYNETTGVVTVTPLAPGTTSISVRARGTTSVIASCAVTVEGDPAAKVLAFKLNVDTYDLLIGSSYALIPVFTPATASDGVTWSIVSSSTPNVIDEAKFTNDGIITGLKQGTVTLKATTKTAKDSSSNFFTDTCVVNIIPVYVDSVTLTDTEKTLYAGSYYTISGTVLPADATDKTIAWTSSDDSNPPATGAIVKITQVDANSGKITTDRQKFLDYCTANNATKYTATITAVVSGGKTAKCTVTVIKGTQLTDLSLDKHSLTLALNQTAKLTPTLTPSTASNQELEWTSTKPAVATVDGSGNVKAVGAGSTVIRAQATDGSGRYDECVVQVSAVLIQSITVTPYISTIAEEATLDLVANLYPANVSSTKVTWSSLNESIAKVDANGKVTGTGGGVTVIRATSADGSNVYGSAVVVVIGKIAVRSISLPIGSFELLFGDSTVLATSFSPANATNTATTWTSSDSSVALVDASGKVTGLKLGSAKITATAGGKSATITITVVSTLSKTGKVVNCKKRVNVRSQPSGASKQVGYANLGARYKVLGQVGNWYKIQYSSSKEGYIWASYLELSSATASYVSAGASTSTGTGTDTSTTTPTKVTITNCNSYVNVRKGAGTSTEKIGTAALNSTYPYLATDGDWIKITYNNDVAYIHKDFCLLS